MLAHDIDLALADEAGSVETARRLQAVVGNAITVRAQFDPVAEAWQLALERMHHGNVKRTFIEADFLVSGDYAQVRRAAQLISGLIGEGASMRRNDKSSPVKSFSEAVTWMLNEVERGISKQRYKGLGEMNPEQLWETTLDPAVRRLLKVQIDDAIAADEIFTTLMGDNVEPRRDFIERNALNARNIDV